MRIETFPRYKKMQIKRGKLVRFFPWTFGPDLIPEIIISKTLAGKMFIRKVQYIPWK